MALAIANRVLETSATTGTGTYSLAGAVSGYQGFVAAIGNGNTCFYAATLGAEWELGYGTVADATPDTLARTTIIASSNGGAAVNWGAGAKSVFVTIPASKAVYADANGNVGIGTATPYSMLDIRKSTIGGMGGEISVGNNSEAASSYAGLTFYFGGLSTYRKGGIYYTPSGGGFGTGDMIFAQNSAGNSSNVSISNAVMTIKSGGNVGIGTTTPDNKLEINTGATENGIRLSFNDADGSATDYATILTKANGETTITTVDSDGALGHLNLSPDGNIVIKDAVNIVLNTTTGTKLGTVGGAAGQKLGFWNATPIVQPVLAAGAGATADNIITVLQTLGLCRQS